MKLSVNIIYSGLKEIYPHAELRKKRSSDNELVLPYPHFMDRPFSFQPNRIYVAAEGQTGSGSGMKGHCLFITPQPCPSAHISDHVSVITVPGADVMELYDQVLTIFDRYTEWDDMLQELVFRQAPLEEFLKCSFPLIGNSMTVHNNDFAYLARVREYAPSGDFIEPDFLFRADLQSDQSVFLSRDVVHYRDQELQREYFLLNLFHGNTVVGRLVVVNDHHPFAPHDSSLVKHLGKYMETALTYAAFSGLGKDMRRDSLLELLHGGQHSADKTLRLQAVSPWSKLQEDQSLYCLVGICRTGEPTEQYIAYQLERALPEAVSVLFDSKIVVLCSNQPRQTAAEFFRQVCAVLEQHSVAAGCSNPFTDVFDLIYYYQQADFSLRQAEGAAHDPVLVHFKDYTVDYFVQYGCSVLPARLICAQCVLKLAEHDAKAAVSYCDSLREYLNTGMNYAETARRLNIRRNTFLARLERILRCIDLDLEKEDDRLYLLFSLRLLQKHPGLGQEK